MMHIVEHLLGESSKKMKLNVLGEQHEKNMKNQSARRTLRTKNATRTQNAIKNENASRAKSNPGIVRRIKNTRRT